MREKYTIDEIKAIASPIFHKFGMTEVYLFGSYAKDTANNDSDLDFLYGGDKSIGFIKMEHLQEELEAAFGKDVDLISKKWCNKSFYERIEKDLNKL